MTLALRTSQSHPTLRFAALAVSPSTSLPTAMASSLAARRLLSRAAAARRLTLPLASAPVLAPRRFSVAGPPPPSQTLPPPPLEPVAEPPRSEGAGASSSSTTAGAGGDHRSSPGAAAGGRRQGGAGYEEEQEKVLRASLLHVPRMGWSESAMVAGARDVGISPAIVGVFPRKEAALVEWRTSVEAKLGSSPSLPEENFLMANQHTAWYTIKSEQLVDHVLQTNSYYVQTLMAHRSGHTTP